MLVLAVSLRRVSSQFIDYGLLNNEQHELSEHTNLRHGFSPRRQSEHPKEFVLGNLPLL